MIPSQPLNGSKLSLPEIWGESTAFRASGGLDDESSRPCPSPFLPVEEWQVTDSREAKRVRCSLSNTE